MAIEDRRYLHVLGTTTELTTNNDNMVKGEIWGNSTLKKLIIAWADGPFNSQEYFTIDIADVIGLTSALAGKAASSHNHTASQVNAGTFHPDRLPIATPSAIGGVKIGANLSIAPDGTLSGPGGGGGGGFDPGFIFDVRNPIFASGIAVGPENARRNTLAIQAAVDAAAVQSGGNGGGTVFLPGVERQHATMIDIESPVWLPGDNVRITGISKESTVVRSKGPCFVTAKHPRFWDIERKILTDLPSGTKYVARQFENGLTASQLSAANPTLEPGQVVYVMNPANGQPTGEYKTGPGAWNSLPLSTGATSFPRPELSYFERYKIDLREFRVGGMFPPNGRPEFAPVAGLSPGQRFALRFWSGAIKGEYWCHPIGNGDIVQTGQSATRWPHHATITWQAVVHHVTPVWWGGIYGLGSELSPDPFILFGAGNQLTAPVTSGNYYFDLAFTDAGGIRKTLLRFFFAQNATVGIHRIAIQFNPAASTASDRLIVFLDGVRVAVTVQNVSGSVNGFDTNAGEVLAVHRVARWESSQLTVGADRNSLGGFNVGLQFPYLHLCDGILIAASVHSSLLYQTVPVGGAQLKVGGGAADDSSVWGPSDPTSRNDVMGYIHNSYEDFSPNGTPALAMYLGSNRNMGRGAAGVMGFFGPRAGQHGTAQAPSGITISDMTMRRFEAWNNGAAIALCSFINTTTIERCNIADQGYFKAITSHNTVASYYLYLNDVNLGRGVHFCNATVYGKNWNFTYTTDSYVRVSGCRFYLDGMTAASLSSREEGVFIFLAGGSIGSGAYLTRITCNFEGLHSMPEDHVIYCERAFATAGDGLWIRDSIFGEFGSPFLYLADYVGTVADNRTATVEITNVGFSTPSEAIVVQGNRYRTGKTMIEVGLSAYTSKDVVRYINARNGPNYNAITTVLRDGHGIPQAGGFIRDSHIVEILRPAIGGPTGWTCDISDATGRKREGSNDMPRWRTIGRSPSRNTSALSANFFPCLHYNLLIPGWNGGSAKSIDFSGVTQAFSRRMLLKTLNATATAAPTHFRVALGYYNTYLENAGFLPGFFDSGPISLSSIFGTPAASGEKASTATFTLNGLNVPGWLIELQRPASGMIEIGSSSVGDGQGAFAFLTTNFTPADWAITTAINPVIAIGGMSFKRSTRESGFTDWMSNRQIDWMTGVPWTPPATWHFGLSTTQPNQANGTGITEPSGGNYARVAVNANAGNFGEIQESSFFANRTPIQFNQPTGEWGEPLWVFASDAASGGNIMAVAPINFPIRITAASPPPVFFPEAMVFQL